ncbi:Crp/Fnr family transcriptional regulator [Caulobacter hibisci]|uniref:Crp/Fnr family transcriptional regulator n=2 Tax=Caulobacter hibisci TaxID=2035993 RepID=A0ABS0T3K2_9CAUL|nr:Crp/Fnr family transcriptional regulator [Caulobacter hibisci]
MSQAEIEAIIPRVEILAVRRGSRLVQRHDPGGAVYIVIRGLLLVNQYARSGREVGYRRLQPGSYFGEIAAIDRLPRSANVTALTETIVGRLPEALVTELMAASPTFTRAVLEDLAAMVRALSSRVFELNAVSAPCRVQMELVRLATEAGIEDNRAVLTKAPTHAEIAVLAGAQREAVTRELNRLEARKLIAKQGRTLTVLDVDGLVDEIERLGGDEPEL